MKGDIGARVKEWGRLTREGPLEAVEIFLNQNHDLLGFLEERSDAGIISKYGNKANFVDELVEKIDKNIRLIEKGVPEEIARLMTKNPDFIDLSFESVIEQYQHLVERDVSEFAAAAIASTDYLGRGEEGILGKIANNYHITRSSGVPIELPVYIGRYSRLFRKVSEDNCQELGLAFHAMDCLDDGYF